MMRGIVEKIQQSERYCRVTMFTVIKVIRSKNPKERIGYYNIRICEFEKQLKRTRNEITEIKNLIKGLNNSS